MREKFETRRLAPEREKPEERGFPLGSRRIPEISIAGPRDLPSGPARSRRGGVAASQEAPKDTSNPGAIRSSSSKLSSRPGNHCDARSARGPAARVGRKRANTSAACRESVSRAVCSAPANAADFPPSLVNTVCPPSHPVARRAYASSSKATEAKSAAKRATTSPPSGATIRRSPTKKPWKGPRSAAERQIPGKDLGRTLPARQPQHRGAHDRPVPPQRLEQRRAVAAKPFEGDLPVGHPQAHRESVPGDAGDFPQLDGQRRRSRG